MVFVPQITSKLDIPIVPVLFHMNPQTYLYACVCVCIGQTSSLPLVTLRMQSSPGNADLIFRLLKAVHHSNNYSELLALRNNFLDCSHTGDRDCKFILFFDFFKSTVERMNERILQFISPP